MAEQDNESVAETAPDQDDLASQWEDMAGEEGEEAADGEAGEDGQTGRVLDQDEIDSLLGFEDDGDPDQSGIMAIINSALVSYERLPMLEVVFDRLVRLMTTSLRNFTSDNVEVSLDTITSVRFGDYLNSIPLPAMIGVVNAKEWDGYCLMTVDSALIYSIVDVLLGGRRGTAALRIEGRPYTTIERNLVEKMLHVVLADLSSAFEPISPVKFQYDRLETNPRFAAIARPGNAAIMSRFRIDMEDRGGKIELVIPYATLEPVRDLLLQMFMGEKFGRDAIWESHLATALWNTEISVDAVLDETEMKLSQIMGLEVGSQIVFSCGEDPEILIRCGGQPLMNGRMGRKGQNIAVRVEETRLGTSEGER